jgi:para-nitrobenzyl esterase
MSNGQSGHKRRTLGLVGLALWVVCADALAAIHTADVTGGEVEGAVKNAVAAFEGIAFAAPPVGPLRWQPPQPPLPWRGIRKANAFAPPCAQGAGTNFQGAEDCLYLNVWTGASDANERRPVLVWIYGGGFLGGSTDKAMYDGAELAKQGVVVVSIAYRVGILGFLAHPDLSRESGRSSGAYGLQDQIAALRWVKANIGHFGGDPSNTTIIGQSAGAGSVMILTAAPAARGLFRRAIAESGSGPFQPLKQARDQNEELQSRKYAESMGQEVFHSLKVSDLKGARSIPVQQLLEVTEGPGSQFEFWAVADGDVIPASPYTLYQRAAFNDTPVLTGYNSDDRWDRWGKPVLTFSPAWFEDYVTKTFHECPSQLPAILAAYPHATDEAAGQAYRDFFRDSEFGDDAWTWARLHSLKSKESVYLYYFDTRTAGTPLGAPHGAELPYVFGNLGAAMPFSAAKPAVFGGPLDRKVSGLIMRYWLNFATNGNPNGSGLPHWPAFSEQAQDAMIFDQSPSARTLPNMDQMATIDRYFACLRSNSVSR